MLGGSRLVLRRAGSIIRGAMFPARFADHPRHFEAIQRAAMEAADAALAVSRNLRLTPEALLVGSRAIPLHPTGHMLMVALGKAAPAMSRAAANILGDRLSAGIVTLARHGAKGTASPMDGDPPLGLQFIAAEHPLPGSGSLRAGRAAAELLADTNADDLVLAMVSGGGSSLMELPAPGIRLTDLHALNRLLLGSGAPIQEINMVRRAISRLKAGGLARLAAPARTIGLILSDVVGDQLSYVASGPTVLQPRSPEQARSILEHYGLWAVIPAPVREALGADRGARGRAPRPINLLVGHNRQVVQAAATQARSLGFVARTITQSMQGEARFLGVRMARRLIRADPGTCLLMGGETTVTLRGDGHGGRNQELALSAALMLDGAQGIALLALGTDGVDGPTDAAGAIIHGSTASKIRAAGIDPAEALEGNDSYPALDAADALIRTGPTGTNLNDLVVGLRYGPH